MLVRCISGLRVRTRRPHRQQASRGRRSQAQRIQSRYVSNTTDRDRRRHKRATEGDDEMRGFIQKNQMNEASRLILALLREDGVLLPRTAERYVRCSRSFPAIFPVALQVVISCNSTLLRYVWVDFPHQRCSPRSFPFAHGSLDAL